ncbi:PREDICTED: F-box/WD repeat-containing protein 10-like [Calidris pugnax]|uniref:F-box/WD repeat-containing protein 10-like n=1 Tax=Calidris pugnax TaxID=198806 RepID=UPI00071C328E|nr:PREDICTED: F-box/WD repeat-containing protein 10-like [Calidris pugnax]
MDGSSAESQGSFKEESCPQPSARIPFPVRSASTSTALESKSSSARTDQFDGQPPATCFWPRNTECLIQEGPNAEDSSLVVSSADENDTVVPASPQSSSNVSPFRDFIRCLPLQLSMYILGFLDEKSLNACAAVGRCWAFRAEEVKRERVCQRIRQEKIQYLQGLSPRGPFPNYAKVVHVGIPQLNEEGDVIEVKDWKSIKKKEEANLQAAYRDLQTDTIQLEERNVFCGSYNTRILTDQPDRSRIIHYNGGNLVAIGSADRKVRFLDMSGMKEVPPLLSGHAGSIKALFLHEKKGFVLSASFDLSIRCWNIHSGVCMKIFNGHCGTITCLDLHEEQFVSGGRDGMVKVWSLQSGKCLKTLKHRSAVCVVKMDGSRVVSGSECRLVKVWCADTGSLIKTLKGHQGPVKCLAFDQWHLVTGSSDGYALGWSMLGNLKRCLIAFRHPKEVLSLEFLYLRVISSCADGKIRVFNFLTGDCLKVLMANCRGDPVSFCAAENRLVINSPTSLLLYQFEDVKWDYTLNTAQEMVGKNKQRNRTSGRAPLFLQPPTGPSPSQIQRLALETPVAPQQHFLTVEKTFSLQAEQQKKLFTPGTPEPRTSASGKPERASSARIPAGTGGKSGRSPPLYSHARPDGAEDALQNEKGRDLCCPMSRKKLFLVIRTLQKAATISSSKKHTAKVREAGEHQQPCPEKVRLHKTLLQHRKDQMAQLQRVRLHSDSLTMKKISTPFETKMLQLKLKSSLYGPTVNSSIPAPSVVRLKTCGSPREKKAHGGHSKVIPLPEDGVQRIAPFTASSDLTKSTDVRFAQMRNDEVSRRTKLSDAAAPSWSDGGFRLLTAKQKAAIEAAAVAQHEEHQAKLMEDQQRARKKAWLRKVKGLPVDSFTGKGKIVAPELGSNTFI